MRLARRALTVPSDEASSRQARMSATPERARAGERDGLGIPWRVAAATVAAATTLLAAPGGAAAATTCELSSGVLDVTMAGNNDTATLGVGNAGAINVSGSQGPLTCAGTTPTTTNTNAISVHNQSSTIDNDVTINESSEFAPGLIAEEGDDELEIVVGLNNTVSSELRVGTADLGGSLVFGTDGINPNATASEAQPDVDIFLNDVPHLRGAGNVGPDHISAHGDRGTGGPLPVPIDLLGGAGNDTLSGGASSDAINGGQGDDDVTGFEGADNLDGGLNTDELSGGDGNDFLHGGSANETFSGGDGTDELSFINAASGVSYDLDAAGTGDIELLTGTNFADILRGDERPNALRGMDGNDVVEGRGGNDMMQGNEGDDSLDVRDGGPDTADCGDGTDTATADAPGIDTLTACESVLFPAPSGPGGGNGPSNDFTFGKVRKNKRKGTAKLPVELPGPGTLELAGKGLRPTTKEAAAAGEVELKVKAKGKKKKRLNSKGKAKVKPAVAYTPTGGAPNTQETKVKLVKR
jgi:Ca2+-binding RTX toxin-like protein